MRTALPLDDFSDFFAVSHFGKKIGLQATFLKVINGYVNGLFSCFRRSPGIANVINGEYQVC